MAQRTELVLTCDVHDEDAQAVATVAFTVEGHSYECELCEAHLAEFREAMEIWTSHSRPVSAGPSGGGTARSSRRRSGADGGPSPYEVREWARAQGLPVNSRGRVPAEIHRAYEAAH